MKSYTQLALVGITATAAVVYMNGTISSNTLQQEYNVINERDIREAQLYMNYLSRFGKSYSTRDEFILRAELFKSAIEAIAEVNTQNENSFYLAPNKFADWTNEEYRKLLGLKRSEEGLRLKDKMVKVLPTDKLPASVDWRKEGAVNPVQDQASCGSCWTFCAVAAIEGHHQKKQGELLKLSEQQFVDCCHIGPSKGCNGGEMWGAFECAKTNAQMLESDYPYTSGEGKVGDCQYDAGKGKVKVTSWWNVLDQDPAQLKAAIAEGPVTVSIQADTIVFQYYAGGILSSPLCGTTLDHGVTAVGYGSENGRDFYIVRNSWGPGWGEQGYIRIGIQEGAGVCGIQMGSIWPETD